MSRAMTTQTEAKSYRALRAEMRTLLARTPGPIGRDRAVALATRKTLAGEIDWDMYRRLSNELALDRW